MNLLSGVVTSEGGRGSLATTADERMSPVESHPPLKQLRHHIVVSYGYKIKLSIATPEGLLPWERAKWLIAWETNHGLVPPFVWDNFPEFALKANGKHA